MFYWINYYVEGLQELCWNGKTVWKSRRVGVIFYQSNGDTNKLGTGFLVLGVMPNRVICRWLPISDRMSELGIRGRSLKYSFINVHCPNDKRSDDQQETF